MSPCPDCGADLMPHCLNPRCDMLRCSECHGFGNPEEKIWASAPAREDH